MGEEAPLCPEDKALLKEWHWVANATVHPESLTNEVIFNFSLAAMQRCEYVAGVF